MIRSHLAKQSTDDSKALSRWTFGDCLTVKVKIEGFEIDCVLYTGSEETTIWESYFKEHFGEFALS